LGVAYRFFKRSMSFFVKPAPCSRSNTLEIDAPMLDLQRHGIAQVPPTLSTACTALLVQLPFFTLQDMMSLRLLLMI
jgi:hypothetical protein